MDTSFNGSERSPVSQRLSKTDSYHPKPSAPQLVPTNDYRQHSEKPAAQHPETGSPVRDTTSNTPPQLASISPAAMSPSLTKASGSPAVSTSPSSASGPSIVSPPNVESTPPPSVSSAPSSAAPLRVSSPPQLVQGLKPPTSAGTEVSPAGSRHMSVGSSYSPLPATDNVSKPAMISSASPVSSRVVPSPMSISGFLTSTPSSSCLSTSASTTPVSVTPSADSEPCEPASTPQRQTYTPSAVDSGLSTAAAALSPPGAVNVPSLAVHESPTVRPQSTLPLLTTEASKTAPMSASAALVSVSPEMGTSCRGTQSSDSDQHPQKALKQLSPKSEHHGQSKDRTALGKNTIGIPEEHLRQLDSDMTHKLAASDQKPKNKDFEKHHMQSSSIYEAEDSQVEQTQTRKSPTASQQRSRQPDESFDNSLLSASQFDSILTCDTPSRMEVRSVLEKASDLDGDSVDDSSHFDNSIGSVSYAEEELSTAFVSTINSSSRDDTLDSTREGNSSETEETKSSGQITSESMLESSLNNTSQMEEPSVDSSDVSNLGSLMQHHQGTLKFTQTIIPLVDKQ